MLDIKSLNCSEKNPGCRPSEWYSQNSSILSALKLKNLGSCSKAYLNGYYEEFMPFMRNLLSTGLKDNSFFKMAVLTGILRVSKESLFSDLNNVEI
jgi:hypothetical protein